jgi:hypothetical protein
MADLYHASGDHLSMTVGGYKPGITKEIDDDIRFMRVVQNHCRQRALELQGRAGSEHFDIVESTNERHSRPRFYVVPSDRVGIHQEISQAILTKAALGMAGR